MRELYLLAIDIQRDFCPGGSLPVPDGDLVVDPWNRLTARLRGSARAVIFSRDFHPRETNHFASSGGEWPDHCVRGTDGAAFHPKLTIMRSDIVISKGVQIDDPGYSAYQPLLRRLALAPGAVFLVGGLATDYCVRATVLDLLAGGFEVVLVRDAIRAVDPTFGGTGEAALEEMLNNGARALGLDAVLSAYGLE
jgi:nicotinamidase/pyrazinamidase